MDVCDLMEMDNMRYDFSKLEVESGVYWYGHNLVPIKTETKLNNTKVIQRIALSNVNNVVKPLMGCTRDARIESEMGYNEKEGPYGKVTVSWTFGDRSDESKSEKEADGTDQYSQEINSSDTN